MNQDDLPTARREAIHALCVAQARDLISVELFELRFALLNEAPSPAAVEAIVADLDAAGTEPTPLPGLVAPAWPTMLAAPVRLGAVFGTARREGRWHVPPELEVKVLFGEMHLDLRDAVFSGDMVDIHVDVICGSAVITLPAGTHVENECTAIFGNSEQKSRGAAPFEPNGLYVRITGRVRLGEVKIRERVPTDLLPVERQKGARGWLARAIDGVE